VELAEPGVCYVIVFGPHLPYSWHPLKRPQRARAEYDKYLPARDATVKVDKLLSDLPGKVPDAAERDFLSEALICFRNKAFRASIVMTWNLTYFHLCTHVLKHKLAEFNAEYPTRHPGIHKKAKAPVIGKIEDVASDLKESEMIEICRSANILTKEQFNALDRQIGRRRIMGFVIDGLIL
jgi:hypothetical protein